MNNVIDEKRKKRFQFLYALYEYSEGDIERDIVYSELGEKIGLSDEESYQISQFLKNQGLIKFVSIIDQIAITHKGILEIENAQSKPQESTEYFPPIINIFINGNVSGSNIVAGNNNQVQDKGNQNDRRMDAE